MPVQPKKIVPPPPCASMKGSHLRAHREGVVVGCGRPAEHLWIGRNEIEYLVCEVCFGKLLARAVAEREVPATPTVR